MIKYIQHDGGRASSKRPKQVNDCVVRAFAISTELAYDTVYDELAGMGRCCGRGTYDTTWTKLAKALGFVHDPLGVAGRPFETAIPLLKEGHWIVQIPRHCMAVINGVVWDETMTHPLTIVQSCWWLALSPEERAKLPRLLRYGRQYE